VVLVVDEVMRTSEVGAIRSGTRRVPSVGVPANKVTATTPTNASTTPLAAATIVDCRHHHGAAGGSYSGKSSRSNASGSSTCFALASDHPANAALSGSGGGHIPVLFHWADVAELGTG
jgi:hypothetical protein